MRRRPSTAHLAAAGRHCFRQPLGRARACVGRVFQGIECRSERDPPLGLGAFHRSRVRHTPVRRHRLSGPVRTHLTRRVVAHGKDEIERGHPRRCKLISARMLRAELPVHKNSTLYGRSAMGFVRMACINEGFLPCKWPIPGTAPETLRWPARQAGHSHARWCGSSAARRMASPFA